MEGEMAKRLKSSSFLPLIAVLVILLLFFMLDGCTTTQERPNREESYEKISFSEILQSPEQHRGKVVRLGGVILDVVNEEKGSTLEILEQPLNWQGRPKGGDVTGGRFLAISEGFLDKVIYQPDREVTVVGEIIDMKIGHIGEITYNYPVLSLRDVRLWKRRAHSNRPRMHIGIGVGGPGGNGVSGCVSVGTSF
jgi:outer membrane lipoprotein